MSGALTSEPFHTQQNRLFKYYECLEFWPRIYGRIIFSKRSIAEIQNEIFIVWWVISPRFC